MKRFRKALLICLGALTLGVTACNDSKEQVVEKKDETTKLTFYFPVNVGGKAANLVSEMTEEFNKQNTDIVVEPVYTGNYDDTVTKIQTAAQGGNPPELFVSLATQRFTLSNAGMAMPLDDLIKKDGEEGKKYIEDFLPGFMEDSYVEGKIYSIPFQRSTMVLFYNKDAFTEVGLDPEKAPKSYKELAEAAKKLTKGTERYGFAMIMDAWFIEQLLANENTLYVNEENGRAGKSPTAVAYNGEKIKTIFNWLNDMYRDNTATSYGKEYQNTRAAFLSGKVSMYIDSSAGIQQLTELANFEIGSAYVPSENGEFTGVPIGGASLWITNSVSDEKQAAAWDFVKYAVSKESQALWASSTGYYSVNKEAYDLDLLKKDLEKTPQKLVAVNEIKDTQKTAATSGAIVGVFPELRKVMTDSMEKVYVGKEKIDKIIDKMVKESDRIVKRYNRLNSSK